MKIFLTGATGFTGSHTLPRLKAGANQIRCLVRNPARIRDLQAQGCEVITGDLADGELLARAMTGCDLLINIASIGFGHGPVIVRAAQQSGIERALFVSTTAIFTGLNAASKKLRMEAEDVIRSSPLSWTILRPTMIYGTAKDRNMCRLIAFIRRWPVVPVFGPGTYLMQPIHVEDLAAAIVTAAFAKTTKRRQYNVAGRDALSYDQIVATIAGLMGRKVRLWHLPATPVASALEFSEKCGIRLPVKAEQIRRLNEDKAFSYDEARRDFGFEPRMFRDGISLELQQMNLRADSPRSSA